MFVGNERKITMNQDFLLQKLKENLEAHKEEYKQALEEWKTAAKMFAVDLLKRVNSEDYTDLAFTLRRPVDSSGEIQRAINMVSFTTETEILLDENTFRQWVEGEWHFRDNLREIMLSASAMTGKFKK